jgi:HlyD family secretion protein
MVERSPPTGLDTLSPGLPNERETFVPHHRDRPARGRRGARWIGAALTATLLAVAGAYVWQSAKNGAPVPAAAPLLLYGNVEIRQVDLAFGVEGTIARVLVDEGDRVDADQSLAVLEQEPFVQGQASAAAALASAEAHLDELVAGFRVQEIEQAKAALASGEAALENAQLNLKRQRELLQAGHTSQQAFDAAELANQTADATLRQARATVSMRLEGTRAEQITQQRAEVEARRATLGIQNYRLVKSKLTAPNAGIVLTRIREPGAVVIANSPVLTVSVIDPVWVRTYVDEPNLSRVIAGAPVRVQTDATPTKIYTGTVGYVSPTAEFTPRTVEAPNLRTALVYRTRILVQNPDRSLRQGMPATVTILPAQPDAKP